jgi:D-hexose-6-phosphate mutarotase
MRTVKKLGENKYVIYDTELKRIMTIEMTRDEAYSHLLRATWEDHASYLLDAADERYTAYMMEL